MKVGENRVSFRLQSIEAALTILLILYLQNYHLILIVPTAIQIFL